jgi:hypothetical protein
MAQHQLRRQDPARQQRPRSVQVGQRPVEQQRALDQARLDPRRIRRCHEQRDRVELPGPSQPPGVAIDVVGDPVLMDQVLGFLPAPLQLWQADHAHLLEERSPVRPQAASRLDRLVEHSRCALIIEARRACRDVRPGFRRDVRTSGHARAGCSLPRIRHSQEYWS